MSEMDLTYKDDKLDSLIRKIKDDREFVIEMVKKCKQYLNIDEDEYGFNEDNELIISLIFMSIEYLLNAGVKFQRNSVLYKQLISLLVFNFYEKRDNEKMNIFISNMINQLRYSQDV